MRVVFTNLDGSLLDGGGTGYGAARPALEALDRRNIPLVAISRRTRAEVTALQAQLGIIHPAAIEDGAAVLVPDCYFPSSILDDAWELDGDRLVRVFGLPYCHLRQVLQDVRVELGADIVGFGDWSEGELVLALGLTADEARMAHKRQFSEIFTFSGDRKALQQAISRHHLQISQLQTSSLQGQWYLTGNADKTAAVNLLLDCFLKHVGPINSLGIATDKSDVGWLTLMKQAVVISSTIDTEPWWAEQPERWTQAQLPGAEGWNESVLNWLEATDDLEE